jgi:hypothetical protein
MLEDKIKEIESRFDFSMSRSNGVKTISVNLPSNWDILISDSQEVKYYYDNNYFIFWGEESGYEEIIDVVLNVIQYNLELEEKNKLYQEKVEELAVLFHENNLTTLKNLVFTFPQKPKTIKKTISVENLEKEEK